MLIDDIRQHLRKQEEKIKLFKEKSISKITQSKDWEEN